MARRVDQGDLGAKGAHLSSANIRLESVRRRSGGRVHLTPRVPRSGPVTTLCGKTLEAGSFTAWDADADCTNCSRRSKDSSRISSAFFAQDAGSELLRLSLEQARFRKPEPKQAEPSSTGPKRTGPVPVRDLIKEPKRPRVVSGSPPATRCTFCAIVEGAGPAAVVYKGPLVVAFMDKRQSREGHVLVVPARHVDDIFALNAPTGAELMAAIVRISSAIRTAFDADGVSVWSGSGAAAGQSVLHLHFHVIPRWRRDGQPREFITEAKKTTAEELERQARAIRSLL